MRVLTYEIVVHTFHNKQPKYVNETYKRMENGQLRYVTEEEASAIPSNYKDKEIFELQHNDNYEKIKSPFKDENGEPLYLYGRYINISTRMRDEDARF